MRWAPRLLLAIALLLAWAGCKETKPDAGDGAAGGEATGDEHDDGETSSVLDSVPGRADEGDEDRPAGGEDTEREDDIVSSAPDRELEGQSPLGEARAILDGYEPVLKDPAGDTKGAHGERFDVISALAVASPIGLLIRVTTAEPMSWSDPTDIRFWIEQGGKMLTVEAKPDHPKKICELTPVDGHDSTEVDDCLHLGEHVDVRIPYDQLPRWLDRSKPYFISGVSTCCIDEARAKPYDEIDGAQEVWVN